MDSSKPVDGFDFHYNGIFDEEVRTLCAVQPHAFVYHRQRLLLFNLQTSLCELER